MKFFLQSNEGLHVQVQQSIAQKTWYLLFHICRTCSHDVVVESLDNMWICGCFEEVCLYFEVQLKAKRLSSVNRARPATKRSCDAALCSSV